MSSQQSRLTRQQRVDGLIGRLMNDTGICRCVPHYVAMSKAINEFLKRERTRPAAKPRKG